jgi:hypothetical protein
MKKDVEEILPLPFIGVPFWEFDEPFDMNPYLGFGFIVGVHLRYN